MSSQQIILFLSLLAVVAQVLVVLIVVAYAGGRTTAGLRRVLIEQFGPYATAVAFVVALVATVGSLYLSEGAHFTPCKLCWYQRIAMYPQVVLLGVAALRRRDDIRLYSGVLATLGGLVSCYHVLIERFPQLESAVCDLTNPCSLIWTNRFGYLTIPTMALSGFALIVSMHALGAAYERRYSLELS